ncbi:hypothetical protein EDD18DRAFT_720036 [Armillaria luteobubalina]|uniref:BZIP domain-containing protein n=1 Tax=Armillaria luteobubalina TaxID=153913 RepID=A0AA39UIL9_9AGAR|nr:hypothetical protein EDD18DRAFT_720036 [Armillaria luteobubalina]
MSDDHSARKKKKNAEAQCALRARQNKYISTLEESVTKLESVMLQLQNSYRQACAEAQEIRQDNARLQHALYEQENLRRAMWPQKPSHHLETDALPSQPPLSYPHTTINSHLGSSQLPYYGSANMPYCHNEDPTMYGNHYTAGSPTVMSSEMSYDSQYPVEHQQAPFNTLEMNPYVSPSSLSISLSSSTPPSSSSATLNPPFQCNFPENGPWSDHADFDYHPQGEGMVHCAVDISHAGIASDTVCFRRGTKRTHAGADRPLLPILPPLSASDNDPLDEGSDED